MNFSLIEQERFFGEGAGEFGGIGGEALVDKPKSKWKPFMKPGVKPKWCRDRLVDVEHIRLEIAPDFETKSLTGAATLTVRPINQGTTFLTLDAAEMEIKSVKAEGRAVDYTHDGEALTVHFDSPPSPDRSLEIEVEYSCTPRRGGYFVGPDSGYPNKHLEFWTQGQDEDSRYWFPCFDYPNEKASSEIIARVPKGMTSLSNGKLINVEDNGDHELHHWKQDLPHVAYLMTLVVGNYFKHTDEWDGIEVSYYVPPGREEDGHRSFGKTPKMVKFFSEKTGVRYPWEKYAQITAADFIFGGMENTGATTQTELTLHDERAHLDFSSDPLNSHELAHQWFGDYLTCRDWGHAWLNESFATYFEAMWCEEDEGVDEFRYYLDGDWKAYLAEDGGAYRRPICTNVYQEPLDLFDRHLYQKGAVILHHLRNILGDRLWWKVINRYITDNAESSVITADFAAAIEDVTGRNFEWFIDQWIYGGGHPEFKVSASWSDEHKQLDLKIIQQQKKDDLTAIFRAPVKVRFVWKGGEETREFEITEAAHRYHISLPKRPDWIAFDPGNSVPKTLTLDLSEDWLIAQLENDDDVMGRVHAARALGKKSTRKAAEKLGEAMVKDKFWGVQAECAEALGVIHTSQAQELLEGGLTKVKHPKARRVVARTMGLFRNESAAKALGPVLRQDESIMVEGAAALALGKTRATGVYDELVAALTKESWNEQVRSHVFLGLCELRDMRGLEVLKEWTAYGRPQAARYTAITCLGRLARESSEENDKTTARDTLEPLLEGDFRTTLAAVAGLQALKDPKAIPALAKLRAASPDSRIKKRAGEAIEAIREAQDVKKELTDVQDKYDDLKKNYDDLKERLEKLESQNGEKKPAKKAAVKKKTPARKAAPAKMATRAKAASKKVPGKQKPATKAAKTMAAPRKAPSRKKTTPKKKSTSKPVKRKKGRSR